MKPFTTDYAVILEQIDRIDPVRYGKTRNFAQGAVTMLSPYISRGVISTKQVAQTILAKGYKPADIESFLKELAWRDYFQRVWMHHKTGIDADLKQAQPNCLNLQISAAIVEANTSIEAIDQGIKTLYDTGYMHNHMRMYVASLACNVAKSHWRLPAQWLYYHLLDADWASNALSWQWVAGSFSSKKYFANQENINKYFNSHQRQTFLDVPYEAFNTMPIPGQLDQLIAPVFHTTLPNTHPVELDPSLPTYVYNFYNLDVLWGAEQKANRVLLLEPSFFNQYPVGNRTIQFVLDLAKNITGIQIQVAEFEMVLGKIDTQKIHYKEHPSNAHYRGIQHERDWMFSEVTGYFPSFFAYWKKCEKQIGKLMDDSNAAQQLSLFN